MFKLKYYYDKKYSYMSQVEFSKLLGLSQSFVSQLLNGKRKPSADVLFQISEKLNIPVERLYIRNAG